MSLKARCPECQRRCPLKAPPRPGLRIVCAGCHAVLEVVEASPVILEAVGEADAMAHLHHHHHHRRPRRAFGDEG